MIKTERFKKLEIKEIEELNRWLSENYGSQESIWLVTYKKARPEYYVSRWDVLDQLICFGWIDGIRRKLDDNRTMQLISPRKVEHWAKSYKDRAAKLIENGDMHEAGLQSIKASKEKGLWSFMDDVDKLILPDDLKSALKDKPNAYDFFVNINDSSKRFVLRWIKLAKTDKTRKNRIAKITELSAKGEKLPGS